MLLPVCRPLSLLLPQAQLEFKTKVSSLRDNLLFANHNFKSQMLTQQSWVPHQITMFQRIILWMRLNQLLIISIVNSKRWLSQINNHTCNLHLLLFQQTMEKDSTWWQTKSDHKKELVESTWVQTQYLIQDLLIVAILKPDLQSKCKHPLL